MNGVEWGRMIMEWRANMSPERTRTVRHRLLGVRGDEFGGGELMGDGEYEVITDVYRRLLL